mmetsp:Transcript_119333/g.380529  ORF Transcript_119333/g.380529 Transcript_119333/m.380529 type:complete len:250 (-) Transcript_119333:1457-2206(-)
MRLASTSAQRRSHTEPTELNNSVPLLEEIAFGTAFSSSLGSAALGLANGLLAGFEAALAGRPPGVAPAEQVGPAAALATGGVGTGPPPDAALGVGAPLAASRRGLPDATPRVGTSSLVGPAAPAAAPAPAALAGTDGCGRKVGRGVPGRIPFRMPAPPRAMPASLPSAPAAAVPAPNFAAGRKPLTALPPAAAPEVAERSRGRAEAGAVLLTDVVRGNGARCFGVLRSREGADALPPAPASADALPPSA